MGAGNDLYFTGKNKTRVYYNLMNLLENVAAAHRKLNRYSKAFGCECWCGIGNEKLYQGKEWGSSKENYEAMTTMLKEEYAQGVSKRF